MRMELSKTGAFTLNFASANPGRCGSEENRSFKYEAVITIPSNRLDADDFVLDHLKIQKFFEDTFAQERWILSCEFVAMRSVVFFHGLVAARSPLRVSVNIIADNVNHKCVWDVREEPVPVMPKVHSKNANIGALWTAPPVFAEPAAAAEQRKEAA